MRREFAEALSTCEVRDGELYVKGNVNIEEFSDELRIELQRGQIPHVKVIASKIEVSTNRDNTQNIISKPNGVNRSYVELQNIYQGIILADVHGYASEGFEFRKHSNPLDFGFIISDTTEVTTKEKTMSFAREPGIEVEFLLKDIDIIRFANNSSCLKMIVTSGTGVREFSETADDIKEENGYFPVMQYYNLTPFIGIQRYLPGDTTVRFMYKREINEAVLQKILRNFGEMNLD